MSTLPKLKPKVSYWTQLFRQKVWLLMALPWVLFVLVFAYGPLWGWITAFQDYRPNKGMFDQQWVGFKWFIQLFTRPDFWLSMRNTLVQSALNLVLGFVTAIGLALLLNEIRGKVFKRTVQTLSYLPYFVSWVVAANIVMYVVSLEGPLNTLLVAIGVSPEPHIYMADGNAFWPILAISNIWKNVGWNAIIYLAAIATINPELYEAADMDGASRFQKMRYITLPAIRSTFVILVIMSIGYLLSAGFDQPYLLMNQLNRDWAVNLDIYAYYETLRNYSVRPNFSYGTAVGIFKTIISLILVFSANALLKRGGAKGLF